MKISPAQIAVMMEIDTAIGKELEVDKIPTVTLQALIRKDLVEQCPRLYFGPRSLRYRLTKKAQTLMTQRNTSS